MVGLPCSGKSSVTRELSAVAEVRTLCEPEEEAWAECVTMREYSGRFSAHMWFRSIRTCQLYQASALARKGHTVIVDSYLDKLLYFCLGRQGMNWLLPANDPYFEVVRQTARIDLESLPLADSIIFFDSDLQTWHKLLRTRSRKVENGLFTDDVFHMQEYLRSGVEFLRSNYGVRVMTLKTQFSHPREAAKRILHALRKGALRDSSPRSSESSVLIYP